MSFAHKVVLWEMQRPCYLITEQKAEFFFTLYCFVVKPTSVQQIYNLQGIIFFNEIVRVASNTNARELTE